jgi:hypothetical protein
LSAPSLRIVVVPIITFVAVGAIVARISGRWRWWPSHWSCALGALIIICLSARSSTTTSPARGLVVLRFTLVVVGVFGLLALAGLIAAIFSVATHLGSFADSLGFSVPGLAISWITLSGVTLSEVALSGVALSGVTLSGVTLSGVTFSGVALSGVALSDVALSDVALSGVTLSGFTSGLMKDFASRFACGLANWFTSKVAGGFTHGLANWFPSKVASGFTSIFANRLANEIAFPSRFASRWSAVDLAASDSGAVDCRTFG